MGALSACATDWLRFRMINFTWRLTRTIQRSLCRARSGDIYRAVVSVGPDGTLIRETYRVREGGVDKVDEIELHVPGNGAGNVDKDGG